MPQRLREGPHLAGIDDRDRKPGGRQRGRHGGFVAAGGFHDDELGVERAEPRRQRVKRGTRRGTGPRVAAGLHGDTHGGFADVDPNEGGHGCSSCHRMALPYDRSDSWSAQLFGLDDDRTTRSPKLAHGLSTQGATG